MNQNPSKEQKLDEAQIAVNIATQFIKHLEQSGCKEEIAYAVFGNAFTRMHIGLGKGKAEWLEITQEMASHFKDD